MNERNKNGTLVEPTTVRFERLLPDVLEMRVRGTAHFRFMDRFEANLALYPAKA